MANRQMDEGRRRPTQDPADRDMNERNADERIRGEGDRDIRGTGETADEEDMDDADLDMEDEEDEDAAL
ncbi:MAG TPA: hypothetical protein VD833_09840 [Vicinamibacterales bacterium]|nr:hypothetical protein [Vicinamibacterales bacterium]